MSVIENLGIDSLKFFTGDGKQIVMQKQYSCIWEIVPTDCVYSAFMKNPSGHFEILPDIDLSSVTSVVNDGYITTDKIQMEDNCTYTVTIYGSRSKINLYKNSTFVKTPYTNSSMGEETFIFAKTDYPNCTHFSVESYDNGTMTIIKSINNIQIVVDEPGQIRDYVSFNRKSCIKDYLFSYTKTTENSGISQVTDNDINNAYEEITTTGSSVTITNIYDLLFFSYKYIIENIDGSESTMYMNNKISITVNTGTETATAEYSLIDFFRTTTTRAKIDNLVAYNSWKPDGHWLDEKTAETLYGVKNNLFNQVSVSQTDFDYDETDSTKHLTSAAYVMKYNVDENQFPYIRFVGTVYQDKISTNFINPTTIVVLKETVGSDKYVYPVVSDGTDEYRLHFRFETDSEMSFVTTNDNTNLEKTDSLFTLTSTEKSAETNAMNFTVGFESDTEGCFCNTMGIFIRNVETDIDYFIGVIRFLTEVEDEDERFRTLFTNFGIPDPIKYPNIFKEQDIDEEGTDWRLVNKKSKELFLYYDEIFPYVGTYKALFNAIKYLGYQDIIFKEWYKIKDSNDNNKFVAIQNYDTSTGLSIASSLKKYGVDFGEYDRYTKLNRLSMVYHMHQIDDESEENLTKTTTAKVYSFSVGTRELMITATTTPSIFYGLIDNTSATDSMWKNVTVKLQTTAGKNYLKVINGTFNNTDGTQLTVKESDNYYIAKNAKLNICLSDFITKTLSNALTGTEYSISIKQNYNSKNTDISGNTISIYSFYNHNDIETIKNIYEYRTDEILIKLYAVKHWLETYITGVNCYISDINGEGIVLEKVKTIGYVTQHEYKDITKEGKFTPKCYQKDEFSNSETTITCSLNEFNCVTFDDYKDYTIERFIKNERSVNVGSDVVTVYESAPLSALTVADEYQFTLSLNNTESGSLYEFTDDSTINNPIIIKDGEITFFDQTKNLSKIKTGCTPVIQISKGNIRKVDGNWDVKNINTSNVVYSIYNTQDVNGNSYTVMKKPITGEYIRCKGNVTLSPQTNSTFVYSSENKWRQPLFFISKYKVTNQYSQDVYSANSSGETITTASFFVNNDEYIIEIIDGSIKFQNKTKTTDSNLCDSAEIFFGETAREGESGEQIIGINYTYDSDRQYIYKLTNPNSSYTTYKNLYNDLVNKVNLNTNVDIKVNRLGDYRVSVRAYDAYNNIFANRSDDICTVKTRMPSIDVIINSEKSNNSIDFYRYNTTNTNSLNNSDVDTLVSKMDSSAIFPINYKIYNSEHLVDDNKIIYDNISYALDTPKANDYMILTNLTEQVKKVTYSGNLILDMKSNNPRKQNIFITGGQVNLCIYDDNTHMIIYRTPKPVKVVNAVEPSVIENSSVKLFTNGRLTLSTTINTTLMDLVNNEDNNINMYVINATELNIPVNTVIENDTKNKIAFIPIYNNHTDAHIGPGLDTYSVDTMLRHFPKDTMIKVSIVGNSNSSVGQKISETAYRIIDTSIHTYVDDNVEKNTHMECGYVIDGNIDIDYINKLHNSNLYKKELPKVGDTSIHTYVPYDVSVYIKPLNANPVEYNLRVNKDALETTYVYGDYDYYAMTTEVEYNTRQLMFNSYFDDSYATYIMQYDPMSLVEIWETDKNSYKDSSLYVYTDYPVTINQNNKIIVKANDNMAQLTNGYNVLWKWKSNTIEDNNNWRERQVKFEKILMFESINKILTVKPYMLGSQSIELYCTDKFGNTIKNIGGGNIFVKENV